jgi:hypothetical protein
LTVTVADVVGPGWRTARQIGADARWTAKRPKGWAFWATRAAAVVIGWWARDRWGADLGWLVLGGAYLLAEYVVPTPRDGDEEAPAPRDLGLDVPAASGHRRPEA